MANADYATKLTDPNEVSMSLLNKYLKVSRKNKVAQNITPIYEENHLLAYYVEYDNNKGWELFSADKRSAHVLASSPEGSLDLSDTLNPAISAVKGMLKSVLELKSDNSGVGKNSVWEFFDASSKVTNTRGWGAGMWVPIDTTYEVVNTSSSRVTSTAWGQGSPWNNFTPYKNENLEHCPVGCVPVAIGQLLYKYIASNPGQYTIPTSATVSSTLFAPVTFSSPSTTAWSNLILNAYNANIYIADQTAIFLSWLGNQMNATYYADSTRTDKIYYLPFLSNYLTYTSENAVSSNSNSTTKEEFCTKVLSSIASNSPVLISASRSQQDDVGHAFLIDGWQRTIERYTIRYEFDPDYQYTYEEQETLPVWMFEFPPDYGNGGPYERYDYMELANALYLKMNWGWQNQTSSPNYNNYSFLVRFKTTQYIDGQPVLINTNYNFSWQPSSTQYNYIKNWYHNFSRLTQ